MHEILKCDQSKESYATQDVSTFRFCGVNNAYSESVKEILGCYHLNEISLPEIKYSPL